LAPAIDGRTESDKTTEKTVGQFANVASDGFRIHMNPSLCQFFDPKPDTMSQFRMPHETLSQDLLPAVMPGIVPEPKSYRRTLPGCFWAELPDNDPDGTRRAGTVAAGSSSGIVLLTTYPRPYYPSHWQFNVI